LIAKKLLRVLFSHNVRFMCLRASSYSRKK
jgi:hypothetical protein